MGLLLSERELADAAASRLGYGYVKSVTPTG
jgi:hypothetical protein